MQANTVSGVGRSKLLCICMYIILVHVYNIYIYIRYNICISYKYSRDINWIYSHNAKFADELKVWSKLVWRDANSLVYSCIPACVFSYNFVIAQRASRIDCNSAVRTVYSSFAWSNTKEITKISIPLINLTL